MNRFWVATSVAVAALAAVSPGLAQPRSPVAPPTAMPAEPSTGDRETARQLWRLGQERLAAGDGAGALEAFSGAEKLVPAPTTTLGVAQSYLALGKLLEARDVLLRVLRYPPQPGEPAPFANAREEARRLAIETGERVPTVEVELRTAAGPLSKDVPVKLFIDEALLDGPLARLPRSVNPGKHQIRASAPGHGDGSASVEVRERERRTVAIVLRPASAPVAPAPAPPPEPTPAATPGESEHAEGGPSPVAWVGLGIAGAGLVVGAITGALSASATADAEERCAGELCSGQARDDLDRARLLGELANAGFGAAGAGLTVGLVALLLPGAVGEGDAGGGPPPAAWVGLGIGGAGIAAGVVTGALALSATASAEDACAGAQRCPDDAKEDASRSRTLAGISTAALAAGTVGLGLGLTALLVGPPSAARAAGRVEPTVGLGRLGARGRF
jgi:hypothetical protein